MSFSKSSSRLWFTGAILIGVALGLWQLDRVVSRRTARAGQAVARLTRRAAAAVNPDLDPGQALGGEPAPDFTLRDQAGHTVHMRDFRGRAALVAFVDSQCTSICPLTTEAMERARRMLGPAGNGVALIAINANPDATSVADAAGYLKAHDLGAGWTFVTGPLPALKAVWRAYNVYVAAVNNDIDHQPIIYLIDRDGREREVFNDQMKFAGVAPQAQVLATALGHWLPGQPAVATTVSLAYTPPPSPAATVVGAPHLVVFFAGWLAPRTQLQQRLGELAAYARIAAQRGWPAPVAVEETTSEAAPAGLQLPLPQVADRTGAVADSYNVQDLPWYALTSASGQILWSHDGWLSPAALQSAVGHALPPRP